MKAKLLGMLLLLIAINANAQLTPPPALSRDAISVSSYGTHIVEERGTGRLRWYSMLNGSLWIARDASGRAVEEWDRVSNGTWRERRTGRTISKVHTAWRFDNGDTLRRNERDAEIRDASGFRVRTIRRVP